MQNPTREYEVFIMALMIWREARGESVIAQMQVGWTVINRVRHPTWWGNNIVAVTKKKWQYSSINAPGDKQLGLWPELDDQIFYSCMDLAEKMVDNMIPSGQVPFPHADSYYDESLVLANKLPPWATQDKFSGQIGHLYFYNIDGDTDD